MMTDYMRYRGRCKAMSEAACAEDPSLRLVRGHYYCPIWNRDEQHWWTVRQDGTIYDPAKNQFPSKGLGTYTEFNGIVSCEQCGKQVPEDEAITYSRYAICSYTCYGRLIGVYRDDD